METKKINELNYQLGLINTTIYNLERHQRIGWTVDMVNEECVYVYNEETVFKLLVGFKELRMDIIHKIKLLLDQITLC